MCLYIYPFFNLTGEQLLIIINYCEKNDTTFVSMGISSIYCGFDFCEYAPSQAN